MVPSFGMAKSSALKVLKLSERRSEINPNDESGLILPQVLGNIEFKNVHFSYQAGPDSEVFDNFSLKCVAGGITVLVGPPESGKSTAIALLQRFYDPVKGSVSLDGHDLKTLNIQWLRSLIGVVQQEPVLFNTSVRENIAYGDNSRFVPQEEIEASAKRSNIHDFIKSLPQGYDTSCGTMENQFSSGQKQRIALARALLRNPKILLLDEATSALDKKTEQIVQDGLHKALSGTTCLTIAHRLSTIQTSDKIVVVHRGKVTEESEMSATKLDPNDIFEIHGSIPMAVFPEA
ncbi:unnamed protein product [Didymodactylos carnosus]|uniref:ABC transporter domain-containing protein n=1 Tax=Didymodactylos carnosus TaxID=1234261 RepID=A0A815B5V7_9BILA|nr:unnamed protein product [Didymodactylos carnosus]CAF4048538.1 unnamed protein product [Didymodactylos carnosus]